MKVAYVDVFQNLPANSGNDWYTLQLAKDLSSLGDVRLLHTLEYPGKLGYTPPDTIKQAYIESKIKWSRVSTTLEQLRPDMLVDGSGVESVDADVVFARVYSFHIAKHIAKSNDAPIVVVMHNVEWNYLKHTGYSRLIYGPASWYEKHVLKKADALTTLSPKDYAYAVATTSADKVFYVPYEPDDKLFETKRYSHYDYGADKFNVLFYGSLNRYHNVEALKFIRGELLPKLKEHGLLDSMRVNVFGSSIPPKSINLEDDPDINFIGEVENPVPFIAGSDVVIVPVRNPCGVKIRVLESLACGKPIVAFPEATHGLADERVRGVITARTADAFVEALQSLAPGAPDVPKTEETGEDRRLLVAARACDAAQHALDRRLTHKNTSASRIAFSR